MYFAVLSLVLGQVDDKIVPPAQVIQMAAKDAASLPVTVREYARYLDFGNVPLKDRPDAMKVLAGHVNQLSTEPDIVVPQIVGNVLLRINYIDYGWKYETWEKLAESDPYFHVHDDKKKAFALSPVAGECHAELAAAVQSQAPILRADWFFNQTAASFQRTPGYYDFLNIKNEKGLSDFLGYGGASKYNLTLREAVADSGVTLQPRGIARQRIKGGAIWYTLDFKLAQGEANPLTVFGKGIEKKYDASEQFFHLPNSMWGTALFDNNGNRQDSAPDFIASDNRSRSNDARVHVNVSCYRCHDNAGLQDIDPWVKRLVTPPLKLNFADYRDAIKFRQEYSKRLYSEIDNDRNLHAQAVKEATGWKAQEYHQKYGRFWESYEDARVDTAKVARDLGVSDEAFRLVVKNYAATTQNLNPALAGFVNGARIRIRQYEEAYPLIVGIMQGAKK